MKLSVIDHLPWLISCISMYVMWQIGNQKHNAFLIGLVNQILWFWWQYEIKAWGLMPLWSVMCIIYTRNYFKWKKLNKNN